MLAYPAVALYQPENPDQVELLFLASVVAYALAIYLFFGIASLTYHRQTASLIIGTVAAVAVGVMIAGANGIGETVLVVGSVFLTGAVSGHMILKGHGAFKTLAIGFGLLLVFTLIRFGPAWPGLMKMAGETGKVIVKNFESGMTAANYSPEAKETYREAFQRVVDTTVRLLPAAGVLSAFMQFAVGLLWFCGTDVQRETGSSGIKPFRKWKVPFGIMPLVPVAVTARLLGGDSVKLVADNALIILAVFYGVTGLALVEYVFAKIALPMWMRVLYYILLFFLQVVGFIMVALLGFVDSFADWRARAEAKISVDN